MVVASGALVLVELCLLVYCLMSIVTTPADQVQHLPKAAWLVLVVVLPLVGGIAWLLSGRSAQAAASLSARGGLTASRPQRARASSPDDDADFLAQLRARAEAQRAEAERARREAAARDEDERPRDEPPAPG